MSLADRILAAVDKAKGSLDDLVVSATIVRSTNIGHDPDTLKPIVTTQTLSVDGFVGQWDENEVDGTNVRADDVKFFAFPTEVEFGPDDPMTLDGIPYRVVKRSPIKVGSKTALTQVQLRA